MAKAPMQIYNIVYANVKVAWELFFQLKRNLKIWLLHNMLSLPWSLFVVNDNNDITLGIT
jgi:hypothetical protein